MRAVALALVLFFAPAAAARSQSASPARVAKSLDRLFGSGIATDTVAVADTLVLRVRRAGAVVGFAEVLNVRGKDQPITVLVAVDSEAVLRDVDVLVYREPYGGEVAYDSWRKQFRGKSAADRLAVNDDIRGISGATISVNAVTVGVRRSVNQLARWREAGLLQ
jgi:Na+-translocating ferredoxin:NAD+ oxidoreductase RnfG subunit